MSYPYPMQSLTASLLTMDIASIEAAAEQLITDDRYDLEAKDSIRVALDLGWDGYGLEALLASKVGQSFDVLTYLISHGHRIALTVDQAWDILGRCKSLRDDLVWEPNAINVIGALRDEGPTEVRYAASQAFKEARGVEYLSFPIQPRRGAAPLRRAWLTRSEFRDARDRYCHAARFERAAIRMDSMRLVAFSLYDAFTIGVIRRELQAIVDEFCLKGRAKAAASDL